MKSSARHAFVNVAEELVVNRPIIVKTTELNSRIGPQWIVRSVAEFDYPHCD